MAKKTAKKASSSKTAKAPKIAASGKPRKKSELYTVIAAHTGLARKQVAQVFEVMGQVMAADLAKPGKDSPKVFVVPGLMKVTSRYKPATPQRKGIDPFTKQEKVFKAKPASTAIKIRPLKALKAMV
ncbi:MAG: HU family DNA-binding protein [Phycisphaeraceae bacterium]|nr:HU family DNA-binding protein [Phycisphaeraceae bacterium]